MSLQNSIVPLMICTILVFGLYQNVDVFGVFLSGAKEGFDTSITILPALVALMTCVGMFKASGALDVITFALEPLSRLLQLPQEVMPLALLRPISGSGALAIFNNLLQQHGPDSFVGRVASVMMGSSETTFYTIAVYFGAIRISKIRYALTASLVADGVAFLMSAWVVRLLFVHM